jgi:hypothetical protein
MFIAQVDLKSVESLLKLRWELAESASPLGLADAAIYHYCK